MMIKRQLNVNVYYSNAVTACATKTVYDTFVMFVCIPMSWRQSKFSVGHIGPSYYFETAKLQSATVNSYNSVLCIHNHLSDVIQYIVLKELSNLAVSCVCN